MNSCHAFDSIVPNSEGSGPCGAIPVLLALVCALAFPAPLPAQRRAARREVTDTPTFHIDSLRTGWNQTETRLTPAAVSGGGFGPLWSSPQFDSVTIGRTKYAPHLYASPLYIDDVALATGRHFRVVFAATGNGWVYAVNAFPNTAGGAPVAAGAILWSTRLGTPSNGPDGGVPVGVLGTPTIDTKVSPPRLYVAADTTEGGRSWKVFALDLSSGAVLPRWPVVVDDAAAGRVNRNGPATFQAAAELSQRGGLNLSPDGRLLYVPFGAYLDEGAGWLVAIDTATAAIASAFSGAPSGSRTFANAGMWGSGGPAVDRDGNVYETTGNGPKDIRDVPGYWGESLLVWAPGAPLRLAGSYTPWNYCQMDDADTDLGGDSPMVIPDLSPLATRTPRLVVFGSKQGTAYLVNRDSPPGNLTRRAPCNLNDSTLDRSLLSPHPQPPFGAAGPLDVFGPYSETYTMANNARARTTPAYFQGADGGSYVFYSGATKQCESCTQPVAPGLVRLKVALRPGENAYLEVDGADTALHFYSPGSPVVTSNGSKNAIVWILDANVYRGDLLIGSGVPHPVLYAVDAASMALLWKSSADQLHVGGKYNTVAIARGVVFVGTDRIQAFGLKSAPRRAIH
jgi:outer membrane protein assembly factor BamB